MADSPGGDGDQRGLSEEPDEAEHRRTRERVAELRARAADLQRQATVRFDEERARRTWLQLAWDAWQLDSRRGGPLLSGGLAYRIFLWQLPAVLFAVSLFGGVASLSSVEPAQAVSKVGMSGALAATVSAAVASTQSARWWLVVLGGWAMLWAGRGAVRGLVLVSRLAWEVAPSRVPAAKGALLFNGFMFVGIALQTVLDFAVHPPLLQHVALWILLTLALAAWVTFGLTLLPRKGAWTTAIPGSLVFAIGSRLLGLGSAIYFAGRLDRVDDLYGGLGVAIVVMLYLYLSARLLVAGIFLNATVAGVRPGERVL